MRPTEETALLSAGDHFTLPPAIEVFMNVVIFEHPRHGKIVKAFYKGESYETIEGFKRALRSENKAYRHHFVPVNGSRLVDEWMPLTVTYETYTPSTNP